MPRGRVKCVQTTELTRKRMTARYFLVRYERCTKCQRALTVEVEVDPLTRHFQILPGRCGRCSRTR
jgi:hypothetical protein